MSRSVLVTGGAGFVGRHVLRRFITAGWPTYAMDLRAPDRDFDVPGIAGFEVADILADDQLPTLVASLGVTDIVHCAGIVGPNPAATDPANTITVNVTGTLRVAQAALDAGARLTYLSTATLYGADRGDELLRETDLPAPVGFYDATKLMGEVVIDTLRRSRGLEATIIRPSFVYGPGTGVGEYYVPRVLAGEVVERPYGADHPCEFTYVLDLVEAVFLAHARRPAGPAVFNISSGELRTLGDLARVVMSEIPGAIIDIGPGIDPKRHLRPKMSLELAQRYLGYVPGYRLEDGVHNWVESQRYQASACR